jgi:hypothetical protein
MTILLTKSRNITGAPLASDLAVGNGSTTFGAELAVNTADKKLYVKDSTNAVVEIAGALQAYPIGAVYISVDFTPPSTLFGGTWERFGKGRTLVSLDSEDTDFDTAEELQGSKTVTLSESNLPSHNHKIAAVHGSGTTSTVLSSGSQTLATRQTNADTDNHDYRLGSTTVAPTLGKTSDVGSGTAVNNIQPSIVVYMWKRTA